MMMICGGAVTPSFRSQEILRARAANGIGPDDAEKQREDEETEIGRRERGVIRKLVLALISPARSLLRCVTDIFDGRAFNVSVGVS